MHGPENIAAVLDIGRVLAIKMHVMHMSWRMVAQCLQGEIGQVEARGGGCTEDG